MNKSKLCLFTLFVVSTLMISNIGYAAAEARGVGAEADLDYKDVPLPEVPQADVNTRKAAVTRALETGGFDVSNNLRRNTKLAAEGRDRKHILAIHEEKRSPEENREYRFALGSGAFVAADRKLFYVKGKQPKFGRTAYPFAVLSKRDVGDPYPAERTLSYSTPVDGIDVLSTKQFTIKEMCKKSKWVKDARGKVVKDESGRDVVAEANPADAMMCVTRMNSLLESINTAFDNLDNHDLIKDIFVGFHTIEHTCAGVFAKGECDSVRSGNPVYQRISLLKENYRSLIWAYNYLLHEAETRSVGPMEGDLAVE